MKTSHSHSIIHGTGIEITLQDLNILQVSNTEIFTLICLRIFLLAKTSFIPFPSGFKGHFILSLLPSFYMCFVSFVYHLQTPRARAASILWQMLEEIQKVNTISPSHRPNILKLLNSKELFAPATGNTIWTKVILYEIYQGLLNNSFFANSTDR